MSEYQYNKVTPEMIEKFKEIAPKRVLVGDEINEDFTHDEMAIYGKARPEVLVEATSTEEVAAVVKLCNENKVPVTPSGARTGLVGGAVSIGGGVMISLTKMNKILGYDKENFVVKIQSGVLLNDLAQDAEKQGLLYPPDPGEKFATVGGNVATNAGGMRAVKYGCTRDYVRAMTVVLPTGEIVKLGATVSKTSSGYSLLNLMIGSEGTLGIITELTLKLIPAPKETISLIIPYENLEDCIASVPKFFMNHFQPQALEFMESSYNLPLTLEEISGSVNMSPKYFCRFFHEMTHRTPIDYLNYYRIERACYQLITTNLSITEIAYASGFNDLSYFIKTFKKYKGTTPKKYLKI